MATRITASGQQTISSYADGIQITVNTALTGTITVTAGSQTIAVITNPVSGAEYRYGGLHGLTPITINPSGTTDITVSILNQPL